MPDWRQYEGEVAGGEFPLERYLGGSEEGAVFLTRFASERAAIKLVRTDQAQAGRLVERWNHAATLRHPHLAGIFAVGTCALAGMPVAYLVLEYAEEDLAEVLRDRPLTTDETADMLLPVAEALAYLHGQGLVHGNLKPSNILGVQDTLKISSETVSAGDPVVDIRALGITLVQALTQQGAAVMQGGQDSVVDELPVPFREIAQHCLHPDSRLRWSAGRIVARLRSPEQPGSVPPASLAPVEAPAARMLRPWHYFAAAAVVVVGAAIVGALMMQRPAAPVPSPADTERQAPVAAPPRPSPTGQTAVPKAAPSPPPDQEAGPPRGITAAQAEITRRVLPDIPAKARNTIHGKATVVVRVAVDPSGNVTAATLESTVSPYFGRLALEAARQWQFTPVEGAGPRNWILHFQIMRTATVVIPRRVGSE